MQLLYRAHTAAAMRGGGGGGAWRLGLGRGPTPPFLSELPHLDFAALLSAADAVSHA